MKKMFTVYDRYIFSQVLITTIVKPNIRERKNYNYSHQIYNYGDRRNKMKY